MAQQEAGLSLERGKGDVVVQDVQIVDMKKGSDHEANPECTGQSLEKVRGVNIDEQGNQVAQIVQTEIIYRVAPKADNQEFISGAKQDLTRLSLESEHVSAICAEAKLGDSVYVRVNKVSDHGAKMTEMG